MENLNHSHNFVKLNYTQNIIPFNILCVELDYIVENNFGDWLRNLRKAKELSQEGLATRSQVTKSYISKLEKNQVKQPRLYQIEKICKALDASFDEAKKLLFMPHDSQSTQSDAIPDEIKILFHGAEGWSEKKWRAVTEAIKKDIDFIENVMPE